MGALQPTAEIYLQTGAHSAVLQASLRVAIALEALPGGIASLWEAVARQKLSALHQVIKISASDRREAEALLADAAGQPLAQFLGPAQAACMALLASIIATGEGQGASDSSPPSDPVPLAWFFVDLYRHATGWLGWSASDAWSASVSEIMVALEARANRELRQAGVEPDDTPVRSAQRQANDAAGLDPDFDRAGLARLRAMS